MDFRNFNRDLLNQLPLALEIAFNGRLVLLPHVHDLPVQVLLVILLQVPVADFFAVYYCAGWGEFYF